MTSAVAGLTVARQACPKPLGHAAEDTIFARDVAHGSQDMYPTFLERQWGFGVGTRSLITGVSMIGAIAGGTLFGILSRNRKSGVGATWPFGPGPWKVGSSPAYRPVPNSTQALLG